MRKHVIAGAWESSEKGASDVTVTVTDVSPEPWARDQMVCIKTPAGTIAMNREAWDRFQEFVAYELIGVDDIAERHLECLVKSAEKLERIRAVMGGYEYEPGGGKRTWQPEFQAIRWARTCLNAPQSKESDRAPADKPPIPGEVMNAAHRVIRCMDALKHWTTDGDRAAVSILRDFFGGQDPDGEQHG